MTLAGNHRGSLATLGSPATDGGGGRAGPSLLVPRPRLLHELDVDPAPVCLVCAPAGSGKTSLLRELVDAPSRVPTAYVDATRAGAGPHGLWSAIIASLVSLDVFPTSSRIHALRPAVGAVDERFVDGIVEAIVTEGRLVRLVIDDLHAIDDPRTFESLDALLARQPSELLLVLSSRHDPPLAVHRPRLHGRVHEIRGTDLAFRDSELVDLLDRAGCDLDDTGITLLHEHTEGWAAGIRIAVLSLLAGAEPAELLTDFGGHDRAVADYLMAEVLAQQTEEMRTFLLCTSVCTALPADLAVRLSGREDAPDVLDTLVRQHALTERIDPRERIYRYHVVLRTYLAAERRRRRPQFEADLQRAAGEWFAERGDWIHALEHLVEADDPDRLMRLLRERAVTVMFDGQLARSEVLLQRLPTDLRRQPIVALLRALLASATERAGLAAEIMAELDVPALIAGDDHLIATLAALVDVQRSTHDEALGPRLATLVDLAAVTTGIADVDLLVRHHWGLALLWLGRIAEGRDVLLDLVDRARLGGRDALAISCLGQLATSAAMVEELESAERFALEARATAAHRGWMQVAHLLPALTVLTWTRFQRVDRVGTARHLGEALEALGPDTDPRLRRSVEACELLVRLDAGGQPYQLLRDHRARRRGTRLQMPPQFHASFGPPLVWAALEIGEQGWAMDFAREHGERGLPGEQALMRAMLLHAAGHEVAAGKVLRQVVSGETDVLLPSTLIRAHLLSVAVALKRGTGAQAHDAMFAALRLADEHRTLRPFIDVGPEVHHQLRVSADRSGNLMAVAHHILGLIDDRPLEASPIALLTPAEFNILRDLPSLLTIRDIAEARSVSTNTVKTHLSATYRKLGVNGRREAVEVARKRGLL